MYVLERPPLSLFSSPDLNILGAEDTVLKEQK
jgi:hypothetical protein